MKNTNACGDEFLAIGRREFVVGTAAALLLSARLASAQMERVAAVRAFRIFRSLLHKSSGIFKQREPGRF